MRRHVRKSSRSNEELLIGSGPDKNSEVWIDHYIQGADKKLDKFLKRVEDLLEREFKFPGCSAYLQPHRFRDDGTELRLFVEMAFGGREFLCSLSWTPRGLVDVSSSSHNSRLAPRGVYSGSSVLSWIRECAEGLLDSFSRD